MAAQSWVNLLNGGVPWQSQNGTALSASASTATISPQAPTGQDFVLPGQYNGLQWYPGMMLEIRAGGTINSGGTGSNLTTWLAAGPSGMGSSSILTTTGALALGTGSLTGIGWNMEIRLRCLAIGSTGNTLSAGGTMEFPTTVGANAGTLGTANNTILNMPETTTAWNTYTAATALALRASLSAAFGAIQCNQFEIVQMC